MRSAGTRLTVHVPPPLRVKLGELARAHSRSLEEEACALLLYALEAAMLPDEGTQTILENRLASPGAAR